MGSTESGAGEFSVGSIVWVRRRNGSWWPGKIVGPDELSASHLTSPRSGTPVKLLGREDASVDWYNLEKSKRVKAFRCGDFNECIKRAECSQGMPIKKREKYARREDAILHALELEKQQFSKLGKLGIASDCTDHKSSSGGAVIKGLLVTTPETLGNSNNNVKFGNSKSSQNYKKLEVVTPKIEILDNTLYSKKPKEVNQLSGEEDHSEVTPRMRGLQDFGLKIANSKSSFVASNGSRKQLLAENSVEAPKIGSTSHANGKNSLHKRKRSHEELGEESLVKRRDRRRTLVQVLQNSTKLEEVPHPMEPDSGTVSTSVSGVLAEPIGAICRAKRSRCVYLQGDSSESMDYKAISQSDIEMSDSQTEAFPHHRSLIGENISGSSEDESDTSETESTESECDSSETEDMDEEMASHSDTAVRMEPEVSSMGRYEPREHGSTGRDDPEESMLSGDVPHFYTHYPSSAHEAVSKWQLKGKRNIRNLTKRSADPTDRKSYIYGAYPEEKDFRGEMIGLDNGYSSSRPMYRGRNLVELVDWGWDDNHHQSPSRGYWDFKRERSRAKSSMLIDVELKVQSSYRKEPIPIVSLMSNLNGKAIIGHPIQIEALEDGLVSNLFIADDYTHESTENDGNAPLPQAWRTARRTANFRVPRGGGGGGGDDAAYDFPFLDRENKPLSKKSNIGGFGPKGSLVKSSPSDRKYKKAPKRASLSSSQKTRTLSSIAIEHKFGNINNIKPRQMDYGSMKPGSSGGPTTVTCIPVKLVFSRLLEKINRPPSKPVLVNSDLERNQS